MLRVELDNVSVACMESVGREMGYSPCVPPRAPFARPMRLIVRQTISNDSRQQDNLNHAISICAYCLITMP
jgi:hypothetical protein